MLKQVVCKECSYEFITNDEDNNIKCPMCDGTDVEITKLHKGYEVEEVFKKNK